MNTFINVLKAISDSNSVYAHNRKQSTRHKSKKQHTTPNTPSISPFSVPFWVVHTCVNV